MKHANIGAAYRSAIVTSPPIRNPRSSDSLVNSDRHTAAHGSAAAIFRSSANRCPRPTTMHTSSRFARATPSGLASDGMTKVFAFAGRLFWVSPSKQPCLHAPRDISSYGPFACCATSRHPRRGFTTSKPKTSYSTGSGRLKSRLNYSAP